MTNVPRMMMAAAGASSYDGIVTLGAHFAGGDPATNVHIDSLMTGLTDSKLGLLSFWFHPTTDGASGTYVSWSGASASGSLNERTTANKIKMSYRDASGVERVDNTSSTAILAASGWHHFLESWDLAATSRNYLYIDDVDDSGGAKSDGELSYEGGYPKFWIGGKLPHNSAGFEGDLAEFYFTTEFLDITSTSNRRKLITAGGNPADLGSDGSDVTGTQPLCYLRIAEGALPATFGTNLGSGGAFSITGTLTAASTNPSD